MKRKYSLRKRHTLSAMWLVIAVIVIVAIINTGYALWSSKLNIYGKVDLSLNPPELEVDIPLVSEGRYTRAVRI